MRPHFGTRLKGLDIAWLAPERAGSSAVGQKTGPSVMPACSAALSLLRLSLGLAVGFAVAWALGLSGAARGVVILDCSMPVAVLNHLLADKYQRDPSEVASLVVLSTLFSLVTLPAVLAFVL